MPARSIFPADEHAHEDVVPSEPPCGNRRRLPGVTLKAELRRIDDAGGEHRQAEELNRVQELPPG